MGENFLDGELNKALEHPKPFCIIGLANKEVCQVPKEYTKGEKM